MNYKIGSEWRKWDLHIHTNASDGHMTVEEVINKALELGIDVIAITDHHTARNIDKAVNYGKEKGITVIPGVEFRTEYGEKSVHMIGLFPYEWNGMKMDSKGIYDEILAPLELTEAKIRKAGKENTTSTLSPDKEFKEGLCRVQVDFKKTADLIHKHGGIVSVHAGSKTNSFDVEMKHEGPAKKNVDNLYDSLGTVKEDLLMNGYIDICEIRNACDSAQFYWDVFEKVSILASDAHKLEEIGRQFSWIKADPTFEGLRQVVLENNRIFLGEKPEVLKRVSLNPSRYIKTLKINKQEAYNDERQKWFEDIEIPLNSELVTIIGNKGSGKSAIADIVGLLLNSDHYEDFQFLNSDRFLKKGFGENFRATLELYSGHKIEDIPLSKKVAQDESVRVKYLPQHYFETICNEIGKVNRFRDEVESVVYQYLPESDKLGQPSFKEFIRFKSDGVEKEIAVLKNKINDINKELILLEDKSSPAYISKIKSEKENLELQIEAAQNSKPKEVHCPTDNLTDETIKSKKDRLDVLLDQQKELSDKIQSKKRAINEKKIDIENLIQLKSGITNKYNDFHDFIVESKSEAEKHEIKLDDIVKVCLDFSSIDTKIDSLRNVVLGHVKELGEEEVNEVKLGLVSQNENVKNEIDKIRASFDKEEKEYQLYLDALKTWQANIEELIGEKTLVGSLKYYESELSYLTGELTDEIRRLRNSRKEYSKKIFRKKLEVKNTFDQIKTKIDETLSALDKQSIEIVSCFKLDDDFEVSFLNQINKKKSSSYFGSDNSKKFLWENIIGVYGLEDESKLVEFLDRIIDSLEKDFREVDKDKRVNTFIGDIVNNRNQFYSYVFSLDYLNPKYEMIQNGKTLDELSPGEKGALLLVFYLALDKTEMPIIIDQPEDNLDNHSVTKILVPFIQNAKKNRQIIMVTHNPNLAIVADAEQVIYVNIDKKAGNKFEYISGSIENPEINTKIVDVLEGTMPAFKIRKNKYHDN